MQRQELRSARERDQPGRRPVDGWYQCDSTSARGDLRGGADQRPQTTGVAGPQLREIEQQPSRACHARGIHPGAELGDGAEIETSSRSDDANAVVIALVDLGPVRPGLAGYAGAQECGFTSRHLDLDYPHRRGRNAASTDLG